MKKITILTLLNNLLLTSSVTLACDLKSPEKSDIDTPSIQRVVQNKNHCLWALTEVHFFQNGEPYLRMPDTGGKLSDDLAAFSREENSSFEDVRGDTPLHLALRVENRRAIAMYAPSKTLLCHPQSNKFISSPNKSGDTPMHLAAQLSSPQYAMMLFRYGSKLDIKNNAGKFPIDLARERGLNRTVQFLANPEKEMLPFDQLLSFFVPIAKGNRKFIALKHSTPICPHSL